MCANAGRADSSLTTDKEREKKKSSLELKLVGRKTKTTHFVSTTLASLLPSIAIYTVAR